MSTSSPGQGTGLAARLTDRAAGFFLVKPDERAQTGYFILIFLLLGAGLAIGRGSADALFFKRFGFEYLPLMFVLSGVLLAVVSTVYAAFADRIPSERFFTNILVVLAVLLGSVWVAMYTGVTENAYPAYFLVYEVASDVLMMHALFYLGQNYETQQAKRLTPLIFAAAQMGKITGGVTLSLTSGALGVQNMVFLWIILCGASVVLVVRRHRFVGVSPYYRSSRKGRNSLKSAVEQLVQGARFVRQSELLRAASFALFFLVVSYYIICYSVNRIYTRAFREEEALSIFFGILTAVNAGSALLIQLFVTGKLLRRFGIKKVNLIFPVTGVLSYLLLLTSFTVPAALAASFNKDALMTAIRNPTRNLFFNALPDYMQGRGRALLAAVVLPLALTVTGIFLHTVRKTDNIMVFLVAGLVAALIYVFFSFSMNRAYVRTILSTLRERVFVPDQQMKGVLGGGGEEVRQQLIKGIEQDDPEIVVAHASLLANGYPETALQPLLDRIKRADMELADRLFRIVRRLDLGDQRKLLWKNIKETSGPLQARLYSLLFACRDPRGKALLLPFLNSSDPGVRASGVFGVLRYGHESLYEQAESVLAGLLQDDSPDNVLAALDLLRKFPTKERYALVIDVLDQENPLVQEAALDVVNGWPDRPGEELLPRLGVLGGSTSPDVRAACARVLARYPEAPASTQLFELLEDRHPRVRKEAVNSLKKILPGGSRALVDWVMNNSGSPRGQQSVLDGLDRGEVGVDWLVKVAEAKILDAQRCRSLLATMCTTPGDCAPEDELAIQVLRERISQFTDVVLGVMGYLEDPATLGVIRACLQNGDSRQIANACEALSELKYRALADGLEALYRDEQESNVKGASSFRNRVEGLEWAAGHLDPWMSKIANRALAAG